MSKELNCIEHHTRIKITEIILNSNQINNNNNNNNNKENNRNKMLQSTDSVLTQTRAMKRLNVDDEMQR